MFTVIYLLLPSPTRLLSLFYAFLLQYISITRNAAMIPPDQNLRFMDSSRMMGTHTPMAISLPVPKDGFCMPVSHWEPKRVWLRWNMLTEYLRCDNALSCKSDSGFKNRWMNTIQVNEKEESLKPPMECEHECFNALGECKIQGLSRSENPEGYKCFWKRLIGQCTPICYQSDLKTPVVCGKIVFDSDVFPTEVSLTTFSPISTTIISAANNNNEKQESQQIRLAVILALAILSGLGTIVAIINIMVYKPKWGDHHMRKLLPKLIQLSQPDTVVSSLAQEAQIPSQTTNSKLHQGNDLECSPISSSLPMRQNLATTMALETSLHASDSIYQLQLPHQPTIPVTFAGPHSSEAAVLASSGIAAGAAAWINRSESSDSTTPLSDRHQYSTDFHRHYSSAKAAVLFPPSHCPTVPLSPSSSLSYSPYQESRLTSALSLTSSEWNNTSTDPNSPRSHSPTSHLASCATRRVTLISSTNTYPPSSTPVIPPTATSRLYHSSRRFNERRNPIILMFPKSE